MSQLVRLLFLLLALSGCVRSSFNLATGQQEYTITSTDKEVEMGRKIARRAKAELELLADGELYQRVNEIGARIVAVCDRRELVYRFHVVHDENINAFALPGGYVYIHDGLIEKTASDDELAGVIAHEVGHITARHSVKRYEHNLGVQLATLVGLATGQGGMAQGVSLVLQTAQLAYSRDAEIEADRLGVKYMKAAGFEPTAMLAFLETLHELNDSTRHYLPRGVVRPHYAMTHPYVPERLRAVKEAIFGVADYIDYLNTPE